MHVLKSVNLPCAMRFPRLTTADGKVLPEVTIPRSRYSPRERETNPAACNMVALTDEQRARLAVDEQFGSLLATGKVRWTEFTSVPTWAMPRPKLTEELLSENAALKARLRAAGISDDVHVPVGEIQPTTAAPKRGRRSTVKTPLAVPTAPGFKVGSPEALEKLMSGRE